MSQALITFFRPKIALMSGYCGGVTNKVELGDLIFFEASYDWDYGKWEEDENSKNLVFRARPSPIGIEGSDTHAIARHYLTSSFNGNPTLLGRVHKESLGNLSKFGMHLCPVASGSAVVANDAIVTQIRDLNDSIQAVDMESYGFYHASKYTRVLPPQFLCVKSVSDFCNGQKEDGLHNACSFISASAVSDILQNTWNFS